MKVKSKVATLLFSIGIGFSGLFHTTVTAKPTDVSCGVLAESCAEGNQSACAFYQNHCLICEIDPYACSETCQDWGNDPMCG